MGNGYSSKIVSSREAESMVSAEELFRFKNAFDRMGSNKVKGERVIDKITFKMLMLSDFSDMPKEVVNQLFEAFDTSKTGWLIWSTFISGLAVLSKGSKEERLQFIFNVFDFERKGKIECTLVKNFLFQNQIGVMGNTNISEKWLDNLFRDNESVDLNEFTSFFLRNQDSPIITWIDKIAKQLTLGPDMDISNLQNKIKNIAAFTNFDEKEIEDLENKFKLLKDRSGNNRVDKKVFVNLFCPSISEPLVDHLFQAFDIGSKGALDVNDFVRGLSILCRGSTSDRIDFAFEMFDTNKDNLISRAEMHAMLSLVLNIENEIERHDVEENKAEEGILSIRFKRLDELLIDTIDPDSEYLSRKQYHSWVEKVPTAIYFLFKLRDVANLYLGVRPSGPAEECDTIRNIYRICNNNNLRKGEEWFVVASSWWNSWVAYVGFGLLEASPVPTPERPSSQSKRPVLQKQLSEGRPKSISNKEILIRKNNILRLRTDISPHHDYTLVNKTVWNALIAWYGGGDDGGPAISRFVIESLGRLELELYPLSIIVKTSNAKGEMTKDGPFKVFTWSKVTTVGQAIRDIKIGFIQSKTNIDMRLWSYFSDDTTAPELLSDIHATLEEVDMSDGQILMVEIKNGNTWPSDRRQSLEVKSNESVVKGLVGLQNLGNTCFMNSSIQSLSNTPLLKDYFASGQYRYDINTTNTMGMQGQLAAIYGELMIEMWTKGHRTYAPRRLKTAIGTFKPQFSGYEQHDAQELLDFLIDGLAEDLNRVVKKPYVEQPDSNNRSDNIVADEWWRNHLSREISIIQAVFTGQYKSLTRCNSCGFRSARFEPFRLLQLPLPEQKFRFVLVHVTPIHGPSSKVSVKVDKKCTFQDVSNALVAIQSTIAHLRKDTALLLVEVGTNNTTMSAVELKKSLDFWKDSDYVYCYEIFSAHALSENLFETVNEIEKDEKISKEEEEEEKEVHDDVEGGTDKNNSNNENCSNGENNKMKKSYKYRVGEEVKARWRGQGSWYHARIKDINDNGTYVVDYEDSDVEVSVGKSSIKKLVLLPYKVNTPVYAKYKNSKRPYPGRIHAIKENNNFDVVFADGDIEVDVSFRLIEPRSPSPVFSIIIHRRNFEVKNFHLNPVRYQLFGHPILIRVFTEYTTGRKLYEEVYSRISRFFSRKKPQVSAEEMTKRNTSVAWGFVLSHINKSGTSCSKCHWLEGCKGCFIPPDDKSLYSRFKNDENIAIDWCKNALDEDFQEAESSKLIQHESLEAMYKYTSEPLSLDRCISDFTSEEILSGNSMVYCGGCKNHTENTKRLQLWRPPPVMVFQLKRFQYNSYNRRKLNVMVDFPLNDLDLTRFFAPDTSDSRVDLTFWKFLGGRMKKEKNDENGRKRSDSLDKVSNDVWPLPTPIIRPSPIYDLYSVVNHVGVLGAGHYTCHGINPDCKKWFAFNDGQVYPLEGRDQIVTNAAYLLFYVRKDMKDTPFEAIFPRDLDREIVDVSELLKPGFRERCGLM